MQTQAELKFEFFILLLGLGVIFLICLIQGPTEESLKKNTAFTYGYITDFYVKRHGNPPETRFEYYIGNKSRTLSFSNSMYCYPNNHKGREILKKIPIIVAYDSTSIGIRRVLITKKAMKEYNYELPDSLKYIYEKYIFRCQR